MEADEKGRNYGCIYDRAQVIKDLSAQGHTLGSHSWSHANMANLQEWQIHQGKYIIALQ